MNAFSAVETLSDEQLVAEVKYRAAVEQQATGALIRSLAEFDARRLYLAQMQLTISRETHDKLRRAQELLRHVVPSGDPAAVLDRALTMLVEHLERQKFAATDQPRTPRSPAARSRYIPAAVRRAVTTRDGGRCAFVGRDGRCTETGQPEFHHVVPYGDGGDATIENIRLRCRAHNGYEAESWFTAMVVREAPPANGWGDWVSLLGTQCPCRTPVGFGGGEMMRRSRDSVLSTRWPGADARSAAPRYAKAQERNIAAKSRRA